MEEVKADENLQKIGQSMANIYVGIIVTVLILILLVIYYWFSSGSDSTSSSCKSKIGELIARIHKRQKRNLSMKDSRIETDF